MESFEIELRGPEGTVRWTVEYRKLFDSTSHMGAYYQARSLERYNSLDTTSETLAAGIYIFFEDQILLVKRSGGSKAGRWECGGGVVEDGETRMYGGVREVFEELGFKVVKVLSVVSDNEEVTGSKGTFFRTSFFGSVGHTDISCIKISEEHIGFQLATKDEVTEGKIDLVNKRDVEKAFEVMEQLRRAEANTD
jgi:8-oxo-dGTP pyrophosphatase MutT (NUDIX family)